MSGIEIGWSAAEFQSLLWNWSCAIWRNSATCLTGGRGA